ncbi:VHS subgroup [Penicillium brevicompactum]|uniref:VHS subgroup n=1 Tax=Penicillium brevicompactum TaxID=5074 RepID=A0A9W9Q589_PENBR|nr:VHS subgroup [Penicillium brevicompactum]KAJ5353518.1 VHS subgroup [Penicillium brevicompactum]
MFQSSKPYSAVTVQIEVLTSEQYEVEDSSGIVDLVEVVRIQASGPTEASRALRKKLKYGNLHRQLRSLVILDFLVQNAGERFLRGFADEALLERLRIAATDSVSDPLVKQKCKQIFGQWAATFKDTPGMAKVTALYKQVPKRKQPATQAKAKVLREGSNSNQNEPPMGHVVSVSGGSGPSTLLSGPKPKSKSKKDKKDKKLGLSSSSSRKFDLEKERPEILQALAASSVASTNLLNALKLVNRETHRVSEDAECIHGFDTCKDLRHGILRYIQYIESEEFLGGLIHANEELVTALMAFEVLDKSLDYDSDSEDDIMDASWKQRHGLGLDDDVNDGLAGLNINPPKPQRPHLPLASSTQHSRQIFESESETESEEEDDDNPFGDRNAIKTPGIEKSEHTWYVYLAL